MDTLLAWLFIVAIVGGFIIGFIRELLRSRK